MDPLSIATSCLTLLTAVGKTSLAVTEFIRGCREARTDLAAITGELTQLSLVLKLIKDDTAVSDDRVLPESLRVQISSIITNCSAVVSRINAVLQNHAGKAGPTKWATFGKAEVAGLRMSLEAHRGSLNLALELVSVSLSKSTKDDTAAIRTDVEDIRQDTSQIPHILEELTRLRAIVAAGNISAPTNGQNFILQQYLDSLTSYAETVCGEVVWDSDASVRTPSRTSSCGNIAEVVASPCIPNVTVPDPRSMESSPGQRPLDARPAEDDIRVLPQPLKGDRAHYQTSWPAATAAQTKQDDTTYRLDKGLSAGSTASAEEHGPNDKAPAEAVVRQAVSSTSSVDAKSPLPTSPCTTSAMKTPRTGHSDEYDPFMFTARPSIPASSPATVVVLQDKPEFEFPRRRKQSETGIDLESGGKEITKINPISSAPTPQTTGEERPSTALEKNRASSAASTADTLLGTPSTACDAGSEPASDCGPVAEIWRKVVVTGDSYIGKTHLLVGFGGGVFRDDLGFLSSFDHYNCVTEVDGTVVGLQLLDTCGEDHWDGFRPVRYRDEHGRCDVHVMLLCFSIGNPESLEDIQEKWILEAQHFCPGTSIILVGLKKDLRNDPKTISELWKTSQRPIQEEWGQAVAREIGAVKYMECSAKTGEGMKELFDVVAQNATYASLRHRRTKSRGLLRLFGKFQKQ